MPIRLMVSDVDGTLVDKDKKLTPATIDAVARLRAAGVGFAVISARPMSGIRPLLDPLKLDSDVAAFNGGIVFRRDGTIDDRTTIDPAVARGAIEIVADAPVDTWVFADDIWYATDPDGPHTRSERKSSAQEPTVVKDYAALLDKADKITFVSDDAATLRELFGKISAVHGDAATIVQSQTYYLDITSLAGNKGAGIEALAKAYGVSLEETVAIGDQDNDIPMLKRAGLSIAMGNASDGARAAASETTRANDADGVAHAIDTIILPRLER